MNARLALLVIVTASAVAGLVLGFPGSVSSAATPRGSGWIVYSQGKESTQALRLLNVTTGANLPLARNRFAHRPSWSPNGMQMAIEDGGPRVIKGFTLSPSSMGSRLSVISLRDGRVHRVTPFWGGDETSPAWSPSGRQIAFTRTAVSSYSRTTVSGYSGGIWLVKASGGKAHKLTQSDYGDSCATWSPDGRQIAFVRSADGWDAGDLWLMQSNGTGQHLLLSGAGCASWSPDGTQMAISRLTAQIGGGCGCHTTDLYLADRNGDRPRLLIENGGSATWSPNGKRIVFVRWQNGRTHLWLINTDGTGLRQLTSGSLSQAAPAWRPIAR